MKLEVSETLTVETFWVQAPDGNRPAIRIARENEAPVVVELDEVHGLAEDFGGVLVEAEDELALDEDAAALDAVDVLDVTVGIDFFG